MAARRTRAGATAPAASDAPTHRVRRAFRASGVDYANGDLVHAGQFRRAEALVSARYLVPIPPGAMPPADKEDGNADPGNEG